MGFQKIDQPARGLAIALVLVVLVVLALLFFRSGPKPYVSHIHGKKAPRLAEALDKLRDDFSVADDFSSNLPLLVFELGSESLEGTGRVTETEAALRLIDSPGRPLNKLSDAPARSLKVRLARLNRETEPQAKNRYTVKLAAGQAPLKLLGLPENGQWLLEGSAADKSMLRNYLAYTLGAEIMPGQVPETRLCEVLLKSGGVTTYQGIYLLSETAAAALSKKTSGQEKGFVLQYDPSRPAAAGRPARPLPGGRFEVVSSGRGPGLDDIEAEINRAQSILSSPDLDIYFNYRVVLNARSFIDTYILNEFMMNFSADGPPVLLYKNGGRRLRLSPAWNFDQAVDNSLKPLTEEQSDAARTLWLPDLFKSADFVDQYRSRYYLHFRRALEPARINDLVNRTAAYLEPAMIRDWKRWQEVYAGGEGHRLEARLNTEGESLVRQTFAYHHELLKIKHNLRLNDLRIRKTLLELRWKPDLLGSSAKIWGNALFSILFIVVFFALVTYARKKI